MKRCWIIEELSKNSFEFLRLLLRASYFCDNYEWGKRKLQSIWIEPSPNKIQLNLAIHSSGEDMISFTIPTLFWYMYHHGDSHGKLNSYFRAHLNGWWRKIISEASCLFGSYRQNLPHLIISSVAQCHSLSNHIDFRQIDEPEWPLMIRLSIWYHHSKQLMVSTFRYYRSSSF